MNDVPPRYRRVLVPLDGSRLAEGIMSAGHGYRAAARGVAGRNSDGDATSQIILDDMAARMAEARAPMTEILAAAREAAADLITMSTHGRSVFSRLLFGSVAEAVLRQGEFPVFLMRLTAADAHTEAAGEALRSAQ